MSPLLIRRSCKSPETILDVKDDFSCVFAVGCQSDWQRLPSFENTSDSCHCPLILATATPPTPPHTSRLANFLAYLVLWVKE